ncbi:MAG: outer membrane beta-barrel protein [Prevotellaceae bacterium]|nr:outer membrane beta-barrel protein [Prevotellaceae bacterium]MDO4932621.1 outer membrane beta-barrel protein [Prevotellaceae bacterium]
MRHIFIMILALIAGVAIAAPETEKKGKKRELTLYGEVYDSFTKTNVKAFVTVMNQDSTVIDTVTCDVSDRWRYSYFNMKVPAVVQTYIVKTTASGYEDKYTDVEVKKIGRNNFIQLDKILMKRKKDEDVYKDVDLEGVVVKGTRVQIAYRGDTIVYDAAAFKLPEGSSLDALIRQLPGAELKDNGDIYINGKKIDMLTINGNDFFKGDTKVVLENLPYFTVKDLKVYYKDTKKNELLGKELEEKEYVMDVSLKREYARGYIANAEAGMGTEERWMAKAFGMYYDDHTRVSVYGNANNVNENRTPGSDGEWDPKKAFSGISTIKQTGLNINAEDKNKNVQVNSNVRFAWNDSRYEARTAKETFGSNGSIFSNSMSLSNTDTYSMNANTSVTVEKIRFNIYNSTSYDRNNRRTASKDSTYSDMAQTYMNEAIGRSMSKSLNTFNYMSWFVKINDADFLGVGMDMSYRLTKPSENFDNSRTHYASTGTTDTRNRFNDSYDRNYHLSPSVYYVLQLPDNMMLIPEIKYGQIYDSRHTNRFNLELLPDADYDKLGWLPSTFDEMMSAKDINNSISYNKLQRGYRASISLQKRTEKMSLNISLPYQRNEERMSYARARLDTVARRSTNEFTPSVWFRTRGKTSRPVEFNYNLRVNHPEFESLMPVRDDSDPLYVTISNPDLKPNTTHYLSGRITFKNDSLGSSVYIGVNGDARYNQIGTRTSFNNVTGVYTYRQDNVDGNWSARLNSGWQRPLDAKKRLRIDLYGMAELQHSVDFATATNMDVDESPLSHVDNVNLQGRLKLTYKVGDLSAGLIGKVTSKHTRGRLDIVRNMDVCDIQYGGNVTYTIPVVKLTVATDMNMYSRRGYDADMNTNELVWNAQLTRPFFKGSLIAKLQAYDILQKLNSRRYSVNAQSRIETWYNNIPRYVMFSMTYKFTRKPNKK